MRLAAFILAGLTFVILRDMQTALHSRCRAVKVGLARLFVHLSWELSVREITRGLDNARKRSIISPMERILTPRQITHDEKKAAEAAFTGRDFNPQWSDAARIVYDGILAAMGKDIPSVEIVDELEPVEPLA